MDTPATLPDALLAWSQSRRGDFQDFIRSRPDLLQSYDGPGNVFDLLRPALFIKGFCTDLIEAGFPVEDLFAETLQDFAWTQWPSVVDHVATHAPGLLIDLAADRDLEPDIAPAFACKPEALRQEQMAHLPADLARRMDQAAHQFAQLGDESLRRLRERIHQAVDSPRARQAHPMPANLPPPPLAR